MVLVVVLAACDRAASPGVGQPSPAAPRAGVQLEELRVDGHTRRYRVFAPPTVGAGGSSALVLLLHDAFGTADSFREATQFDAAATAGDFIVAYPESLEGTWNGGFCCGRARADVDDVDDVRFLRAVIDEIEADYPVDRSRLYAVGASNGAIMAYRLACDLGDRLAAVAAVGGAMVPDDCDRPGLLSVLAVHGSDDGHVPYDGGPTSGAPDPVPSQPAIAAFWAERNGCAGDGETRSDGPVRTHTWSQCRSGTAVRLVTVDGGGHTWFSGEFSGAAGAVDTTDLVVDFFGLAP